VGGGSVQFAWAMEGGCGRGNSSIQVVGQFHQ
jgi:hypothetical protein